MIVRLYGPLSIELIATVITKVQIVIDHVYAYPMNLINTHCTVTSASTKLLFLVVPLLMICEVCKCWLIFPFYVIEFFLIIPPHSPMESTVFPRGRFLA